MLRPDTRRRALSATRLGVLRWASALAVSAVVCWMVWTLRPTALTAPIDVVGYPSFTDYSFQWMFWAWRICVWMFPVVAFVAYLALGRVGPWRRRRPVRRTATAPAAEPTETRPARLLPVLVPALLVTYAVSALPTVVGGGLTLLGLGAGAAFALAQIAASRVVARERVTSFAEALAVVSAPLGVVVAVAAMFITSERTITITDGSTRDWPWLPWWLAGLALVAGLGWVTAALRRGWPAAGVERAVRVYGLGGVATYVGALTMPILIGYFQGFDDSQSVTGADLLTRGYFPWTDFQFIHGLWEDALRSTIGFEIFEPTMWGTWAAVFLIVVPLFWTFLYFLVARLSPRGSLVPLLVPLMAGAPFLTVSFRWMAFPIGFLLLAAALRRSGRGWTVLLTVFLFVDAVLVPESTLQVAACALVLLLADVRRRPEGARWWRQLDRFWVFVATGAALSALLVVFLAATGSLGAFLGYYVNVGAGHNEAGALPPSTNTALFDRAVLVGIAVCVVAAILWVAWRWTVDRAIQPIHWTLLAAALVAGAYGEKAVGRFDDSHVQQSLTVAMPLFLIWLILVARFLDARVRLSLRETPPSSRVVHRFMASAGQPVVLVALLFLVGAFPQTLSAAVTTPSHTKADVSEGVYLEKVGYLDPSEWDLPLLQDLDKILDTYAGEDETVFDFTNAPGYFYYYLGRDMPTPMVHISLALTPAAQRSVIDDLERSRPPVVAFTSTGIGYAQWGDGITGSVRHYEIGQYLLDGWTPVLDADEVLFLLRNDLVADAPAPPELNGVADTTDLYFTQPVCDWGYSANYVTSVPDGEQVSLPVEHRDGLGVVTLPASLDLRSVQLIRFEADDTIGPALVGLSDDPADATLPGNERSVTFSVLPSSGTDIGVRVGSCLPWHGFQGTKLYLTQKGGQPIDRVVLSGVRPN